MGRRMGVYMGETPWRGKPVRATLDVKLGQVTVFYQKARNAIPQRIAEFSFPIKEEVYLVDERFRRPAPSLWPDGAS